MMDRHSEPRNDEMVEKVARLIEQSSFGTVGARQLRDRTSSVSRDQALLQAHFSATTEGRTWWHAHRNDADELYDAAKSFADDNPEDHAISERLMNIAAALGHPEARSAMTGESGRQPPQACPARAPSVETDELSVPSSRGAVHGRGARRSVSPGMDWRSFEKFFATFLDPLTVTVSEETWLRAERSRAVLIQAMKAAFDNWEAISATGRPEEWVLGYALRRQRRDTVRNHCASRSISILILECCAPTRPLRQLAPTDSDADLIIFKDADIRITGAIVAAVQGKVRTGSTALPSPVAQLAVECKQYWSERQVDTITAFPGSIDVDEAVTRFYIQNFRSTVRLATLLVGEVSQAEEIAVSAFDAAHHTWQQSNRSFDEAVIVLRQSLVNKARAVNRYRKSRKLAQQMKALQQSSGGGNGLEQESGSTILTAMQQLPVRQREAMALCYYADLSISQIADAMGVTPPAALTHMKRGTEEIRFILGGSPSPSQTQTFPGQLSVDADLERNGDKIS
jgi:DNA-directed RNA polymerase specialized sigma24 family protein